VRSISLREPLVVSPDTGLLEMLRLFQKGKTHLALVSEEPALALDCLRKEQRPPHSARYLGIVTLEDVLERIIQEEIQDEKDHEKIRGSNSNNLARNSSWYINSNAGSGTDIGSIHINMPDYNIHVDDHASYWLDNQKSVIVEKV